MAGYGIPKPAGVTPKNIIRPTFDELSEDQRQAFEAIKIR
jgi:hypothetical protein